MLTLSRICASAITGKIAPKDVAADRAIKTPTCPVSARALLEASVYLGTKEDHFWPHAQIT
ncbi:DUF4111 domain-containing protein [Salmonella enterica subsp. enterica]|nr:DUF4111 domain-containing protein [Salmonella enterica subsp. enterica]